MKWDAFRELFWANIRGSSNETIKDFLEYLLLAIDASHIVLPPDAALREYYATGHELSAATARASVLYDSENNIIADTRTEPLAVDEWSLAKEHLQALGGMALDLRERKPIGIGDRGYPSKDFVKYLRAK